jgi:hypothetical protein
LHPKTRQHPARHIDPCTQKPDGTQPATSILAPKNQTAPRISAPGHHRDSNGSKKRRQRQQETTATAARNDGNGSKKRRQQAEEQARR